MVKRVDPKQQVSTTPECVTPCIILYKLKGIDLEHEEEERELEFENCLKQDTINLEQLKKISWHGIPVKYRAKVWKLLFVKFQLYNRAIYLCQHLGTMLYCKEKEMNIIIIYPNINSHVYRTKKIRQYLGR